VPTMVRVEEAIRVRDRIFQRKIARVLTRRQRETAVWIAAKKTGNRGTNAGLKPFFKTRNFAVLDRSKTYVRKERLQIKGGNPRCVRKEIVEGGARSGNGQGYQGIGKAREGCTGEG